MTPFAITVLALVAACAGALIGYLLARVRAAAGLSQTQSELASARTALAMEKEKAAEQLLTQNTRFIQQSQEVLEEKSLLFARQNQDSLDKLLVPLKERIEGFEKQVRETRQSEGEARAALIEQIRSLQESSRKSSAVAENLASALKGQSKTQGNWGEMILERILELSGLTRGREYETQFSASTGDGERRQPDAVVHLPDQRDIVIDSKVSLTAFVRATEAADDAARSRALAEHVQSVRTHLQELSAKDYQKLDGIRSLDFVLMFVPSEAAYIEAIRAEPKLFEEALATGADSLVVSMLTEGRGTVQQAAAAAQNSKLGTGGSKHRHGSAGEWVDHGHHALMRIAAFSDVGGYDESFSHNEDAELDHRLRQAGYRIWMSGRTRMTYFPRASLGGLFHQYLGYGRGRARNVLKHRVIPRLRQMVPLMVAPTALLASLAVVHWIFAVPVLVWAAICLSYGAALALRAGKPGLALAGVSAMVMHFAWSLGFWLQLAALPARGRPA